MNEQFRAFFWRLICRAMFSAHTENWILHQLLEAVERCDDAKVMDEIERLCNENSGD